MNAKVLTVWIVLMIFFVSLLGVGARISLEECGPSATYGPEYGVVKIITDVGTGTGFVVHESGVIVTAGHMFWDEYRGIEIPVEGRVIFKDGREYEFHAGYASPIQYSIGEDRDYAFIKLDTEDTFETVTISNATDTVVPGTDVYIIGMPLGVNEWHWSFGDIAATVDEGEFEYELDVDANGGNSGGPLFLEDTVIGILVSGYGNTDISFATMFDSYLIDELNSFIYQMTR